MQSTGFPSWEKQGREKMRLNIGGHHYDITLHAMERVRGSKLYRIAQGTLRREEWDSELFFERPRTPFEAILAFHQTGKLHIPGGICPGAFKEELEFWEIDPHVMENCCYHKYVTFLREQGILEGFLRSSRKDQDNLNKDKPSVWSRIRRKLWHVLDNKDRTVVTKVYFAFATAFILLAIFATALSTLPSVRNKGDANEYDSNSTNTSDIQTIEVTTSSRAIRDLSKWCVGDCSHRRSKRNSNKHDSGGTGNMNHASDSYDEPTTSIPTETASVTVVTETVSSTNLIQNDVNGTNNNMTPSTVQNGSIGNGTVDYDYDNWSTFNMSFNGTFQIRRTLLKFPNVREIVDAVLPEKPKEKIFTVDAVVDDDQMIFIYIEYATNFFFTGELILRLICCPKSRRYIFSLQNLVDFIALTAVYLRSLLYLCVKENYYSDIDMLLYMQMLRVLRLLRLLDNVTAFKVLCYSLKVGKRDMFIMLLYVVIGVLFFSNFIYFFEKNDDFPSIPDAWWWSMVTMTTVGYGDFVPKTAIGKVIGSLCAFSGVLMFSLIIPIFVNNFLTLYQYADVHEREVKAIDGNHKRESKANSNGHTKAEIKL